MAKTEVLNFGPLAQKMERQSKIHEFSNQTGIRAL